MSLDPGGVGKDTPWIRWLRTSKQRCRLRAGVGRRIQYLRHRNPPNDPRGWYVRIRDPKDESKTAAEIYLKDNSSPHREITKNSFLRRASFIVTSWTHAPDTLREGMLSVSVIAPRTLDSEVWAKPYYILGREWTTRTNRSDFRVLDVRGQTRGGMHVAPVSGRFLDACRRRATDVRPVWFMRQAGRYLKPYREIRAKHSILEICKKPVLAADVTLQPVEILDVDAAIIFADLLLPLEPMGLKVEFIAGEGPSIENPISTPEDIDDLSTDSTDDLGYVGEAIQMVTKTLAGRVPVIGFRRRAVYGRQLHDRRRPFEDVP